MDTEIARVLAKADTLRRMGIGEEDCDEAWQVIDDSAALIRALRDERDKIDRIASELMDTVHMQAQKLAATEAERDALRKFAPKGLAAFVHASPEERERIGNEVGEAASKAQLRQLQQWDHENLREAGPTPFQGRTTRRE